MVLMSLLPVLEAASWVVARCIQGCLAHVRLGGLLRHWLRVGCPGGVLAEDTAREWLLLISHCLLGAWISSGRCVFAIEMAEELLACIAVARVYCHI